MLTQIWGYRGWKVVEAHWEDEQGQRLVPVAGYDMLESAILVLCVKRRWVARCSHCLAICSRCHERRKTRRWKDLPWAGRRVDIEYAAERVKCWKCGGHATELLAWAESKQRQTRRFQQHLALDAFSMPLLHVSTKYGLSWHTVRRAELDAIQRWERTRPPEPLCMVGVDEKYLGRRNKLPHKFVTIVSNLQNGEPLWIGYGRSADTLKSWLVTLTAEQKGAIRLFAMDMHNPFRKAVEETPGLRHADLAHDPFHVMKRAGEAISELRREVFFRAGTEMRAVGRGTRWLVLKAWERTSEQERATLRRLFSCNGQLARAYQVVEELRAVLHAPDENAMGDGLWHILSRTRRRDNVPLRKLHESLINHLFGILALSRHHPPTGRIEALNTNWEALVRRGRGYRNHHYLLAKLRFMTTNPVRSNDGVRRFLALGLPAPMPHPVAA